MIGGIFPISEQTYGRGLEGLVAGNTRICDIDGSKGRLWYRGYAIEDLAEHCSFEQVSYLILYGELPDQEELHAWTTELSRWRHPPDAAIVAARRLPHEAHPLAVYRTMLTVAACLNPDRDARGPEAQWRRPGRILSWSAALAAAAIRHFHGLPPVDSRDDLGFAANFLDQALGRQADPDEVRAFEATLIVQAEHGLHAAALAALVVISTGADMGSAVLSGMGALSGARHGGANQLAYEVYARLPDVDAARVWAREAMAAGGRIPGFGHRVYKCPDPRVRILEPHAERLTEGRGKASLWQVYLAIRQEVEAALAPKGVYANVDGITGLIYAPLGFPASAFTIPFCLAIETGWMAHCLEYLPQGKMIEPGAVYVPPGAAGR